MTVINVIREEDVIRALVTLLTNNLAAYVTDLRAISPTMTSLPDITNIVVGDVPEIDNYPAIVVYAMDTASMEGVDTEQIDNIGIFNILIDVYAQWDDGTTLFYMLLRYIKAIKTLLFENRNINGTCVTCAVKSTQMGNLVAGKNLTRGSRLTVQVMLVDSIV